MSLTDGPFSGRYSPTLQFDATPDLLLVHDPTRSSPGSHATEGKTTVPGTRRRSHLPRTPGRLVSEEEPHPPRRTGPSPREGRVPLGHSVVSALVDSAVVSPSRGPLLTVLPRSHSYAEPCPPAHAQVCCPRGPGGRLLWGEWVEGDSPGGRLRPKSQPATQDLGKEQEVET